MKQEQPRIRSFRIVRAIDIKKFRDKSEMERAPEKAKVKTESCIPYISGRVSRKIYKLCATSAVGRFLSSYDRAEARVKESYILGNIKRLYNFLKSKGSRKPIKESLPEEAENVVMYREETVPRRFTDISSEQWHKSKVLKFISQAKKNILYTGMSSYGAFVLAFALVMLAIEGVRLMILTGDVNLPMFTMFFDENAVDLVTHCIIAFALILSSIPLILAGDIPFIKELFRGRIAGSFLIGVMGLREVNVADKGASTRNHAGGFLLGVALGILTLVISPINILKTLLIAIFVVVTLASPETGIVVSLFLLPFLSSLSGGIYVIAAAAVILLSALLKVISGERVMNFTLIDLSAAVFLLLILSSGAISAGGKASIRESILFCIVASIYFVMSSLMKSKQWLKRVITAISASGLIISVIVVIAKLAGIIGRRFGLNFWLKGIDSLPIIPSDEALSVYLVLVIFTMAAYICFASSSGEKGGGTMAIIFALSALVLTESYVAISVLILAFIGYKLLKSPKIIFVAIVLVVLFVIAYVMLPSVFTERVDYVVESLVSSIEERTSLFLTSNEIIRDNFLCGIGFGKIAFQTVYSVYSPSGVITETNAGSLYTQILIETGIGGIISFILFVTLFVRVCFTVCKKYGKSSEPARIVRALTGGIIALLIFGLVEYVWSDVCVLFLFWAVVGVCLAVYRRKLNDADEYGAYCESECLDIELPVKERKKTFRRKNRNEERKKKGGKSE